ncbi:MAG: hypothetical protein MI723_07300 [Caulobacterales bacterium]|nr:hypothetical protein [Caulobacterales bacterium]
MAISLRVLAGLAAAAGLGSAASAGPQFVDANGVANFGYDVVAYHTGFAATMGSDTFTAEHNSATFWFASAENRDRFAADPARFAPAYDGHCAFALTAYKKLTVDPEAFSIVDPATGAQVDPAAYDALQDEGVLYLNYSPSVNRDFNKDIPANLAKADEAWIDCLEHRPAARPKKRPLRDLIPRGRPNECPAL